MECVSLVSCTASSSSFISQRRHHHTARPRNRPRRDRTGHASAATRPAGGAARCPGDGSDASHAAEASLSQLQLDLGVHLGVLLRLLVGVVQVLHEHGHHHVDQDELGREHEGHEIHGRDELQPGVAAVVAAWTAYWAFPQRVLVGGGVVGEIRGHRREEGRQGQTGGQKKGKSRWTTWKSSEPLGRWRGRGHRMKRWTRDKSDKIIIK